MLISRLYRGVYLPPPSGGLPRITFLIHSEAQPLPALHRMSASQPKARLLTDILNTLCQACDTGLTFDLLSFFFSFCRSGGEFDF